MKQGLSLIEVLIALSVMGVLISVGTISLVGSQRRLALEQATIQLAADLNSARMEARRTNKTIDFIASNGSSSYEFGPAASRRTVQLPDGISFTQGMSLSFSPPYGVLNIPNSFFQISRNGYTKKVNLIGILGKVVVHEM